MVKTGNNTESQIRWGMLPLDQAREPTEGAVDDLIYIWMQIKKIDWDVQDHYLHEYTKALSALLREDTKILSEVESSFHREEKLTPDGRRPSDAVFHKLVQYYRLYNRLEYKYSAPCTSIVGPSGIGKSFSVMQMTLQHNMYVVYSSLAEQGSLAYPTRSAIADELLHMHSGHSQVRFWECYVTLALVNVELCKTARISPIGVL